jgi:hypothetical protein
MLSMMLMAAMPAKKTKRAGEISGGDFPDADEDATDNQVQQSPEDVDGGRGESFAGWFGKRGGEAIAADAFDEVRDEVGEEHSGEEAGDVVVPGHGDRVQVTGDRLQGIADSGLAGGW